MSLGYVKGRYWISDDRYAAYSQRDSMKRLTKAMRLAGYTFDCEYSYTARQYTAEVQTAERFEKSAQWYIIKHGQATDENPMSAIVRAVTQFNRCTPLIRVVCLEIELELLSDAVEIAREREKRRAALEAKVHATLDRLADALRSLTLIEPRSADPSDVAAAQWENIQSGAVKPVYDEDDDL